MTIVTGDRYLESLVKFVEKQAGPLIEGTLVLKLNPVGLHYVQSRLESLAELERLLAGAPVDYLRAYVSDLGDHRALEQLRRILRLLTSLKVISVLPPPSCRDPTPLCLLPFGRLKVLELRGCDLSTSAARGLLELRHTLEKIICHNSTDALRHVFASRIAEIKDSPQWRRLSFVSCAYNGLVLMDDSLRLLPVVETLDLSRNKFAKVDNIWKCAKLKHLDLGFNQLRTIASLSKVTCQIVKLVLRNNALTNLRGVENLKSLEGLDLSYNIISNFSELELLAGLPSLRSLWLEGNPVCSASWYRAQVYSFFPDPDKLILDDKKIGTREVWKRQIIIASRHKQPASFGYYSPAIDEAELEGSINANRKKLSRLASIESESNTVVYSDNDSLTCIDEAQSKQDIADSNEGAEIVDFINKIEFTKRERSGLWLEEFKQWMSHISQDLVESDIHSGIDLTPSNESDSKKKKRQKHFGETSRYASKSIEASGDENSVELSESFITCDDFSINAESQRYADKDVRVPNHKQLGSHYNRGVNPIRNTRSHIVFQVLGEEGIISNKNKVQGVEVTSPDNNFMPLDAIDDVIEARSPSACAGSPPHYQEHILHRRHNMEEEFLQLSAESYSVASSDSYTSNSGDDSVEVGSLIHNASTADDVSRRVDIPSVSHISEDSYCDKRKDMLHFTENGTCSSSACSDYTFDMELKESDTLQQSHNSYQGATYDGEIIRLVKQEADWLEKKISNRKPKRRVVSLTEKTTDPLTYETYNDEVMKSSDKLNGSARVNRGNVQDAYRREAYMNGDFQMLADEEHSINNMGGEMSPGKQSSAPGTEEFISNYLNAKLAAVGVQETCMQYVCCKCVLDESSGCHESEVVVLLSNEQKVYILLLNGQHDGSGSCPSRVGTFGAEDVKEVLVGIGLQAVRVYIRRGAKFMFITRSTEKSRQLISLLEFLNSHAKKGGFPLISLDQIQVALFERGICGGSRTNILQYSMVLFWNDNLEEDQWLSRSLFVLGGHMLMCIEDISQFGFDNQDAFTPYYSLDSCCSIVNALEMVIESDEIWCVTLTLESVTSEFCVSNVIKNRSASHHATWKLKWFSEDALFKFVQLLKALHPRTTSSPLIIRRITS